jgi:hypothetical protein
VQREALNGTQFKFTVADATIRNLKTAQVRGMQDSLQPMQPGSQQIVR